MKTMLFIVLFGIGAYLLGKKENGLAEKKNLESQEKPQIDISFKPDLAIILNQDVSGSRLEYGVDLLSSDQLLPYYYETSRNINLVFSLISDTSIGRPIQVSLERKNFVCPQQSDYINEQSDYRDRRSQKLRFSTAKRQYVNDSLNYFKKRDGRFKLFCWKVDSIVSAYKDQPDTLTDIGTCVETDRKVLRFYNDPQTTRVVILNSDGQDNRNKWKKIKKLPAKVVLVNSGPEMKTPIDNLVDLKLATLENAIQYSLTL